VGLGVNPKRIRMPFNQKPLFTAGLKGSQFAAQAFFATFAGILAEFSANSGQFVNF
jgi:hypothetical protein